MQKIAKDLRFEINRHLREITLIRRYVSESRTTSQIFESQ